jgi:hypothetical protein
MVWPVTSALASEARNTTSPATSSGVPKASPLRSHSGSASPRSSSASTWGAKAGIVRVISVAAVGTMQLTVTSARANSMAHVRAIAVIPALQAA